MVPAYPPRIARMLTPSFTVKPSDSRFLTQVLMMASSTTPPGAIRPTRVPGLSRGGRIRRRDGAGAGLLVAPSAMPGMRVAAKLAASVAMNRRRLIVVESITTAPPMLAPQYL